MQIMKIMCQKLILTNLPMVVYSIVLVYGVTFWFDFIKEIFLNVPFQTSLHMFLGERFAFCMLNTGLLWKFPCTTGLFLFLLYPQRKSEIYWFHVRRTAAATVHSDLFAR